MQSKSKKNIYIKELNRYLNRTIFALENSENWQEFHKKAEDAYERLAKIEPVELHSSYYTKLLALINTTISASSEIEGDMERVLGRIKAELNQLEKQKRVRSYRREKRSSFDEEEW